MLFNVNVLYNDSSNDEKDTEFSYKNSKVNELPSHFSYFLPFSLSYFPRYLRYIIGLRDCLLS